MFMPVLPGLMLVAAPGRPKPRIDEARDLVLGGLHAMSWSQKEAAIDAGQLEPDFSRALRHHGPNFARLLNFPKAFWLHVTPRILALVGCTRDEIQDALGAVPEEVEPLRKRLQEQEERLAQQEQRIAEQADRQTELQRQIDELSDVLRRRTATTEPPSNDTIRRTA